MKEYTNEDAKENYTKKGRPVVAVDLEMVEDLAKQGVKQEEIANIMEFSVSLFQTHKDLKRLYKRVVAERKAQLRMWQTQQAKSGNVSMLIWLGKQELGQHEPIIKQDVTINEKPEVSEKMKKEIAAIKAGYNGTETGD